MNQNLRVKLPYIIVIGLVYLIMPALLLFKSTALSYLVLIGLLPLTALLCCAHYAMRLKNEFLMCLIAPILFFPAMFLYGIVLSDPLRAIIYLIAYFLCGYLGLTIGEILASRKSAEPKNTRPASRPSRPAERRPEVPAVRRTTPERVTVPAEQERRVSVPRPAARPRPDRVAVEAAEAPQRRVSDLYDDHSLDTSTTEDDIDAILRELHQRRSGD